MAPLFGGNLATHTQTMSIPYACPRVISGPGQGIFLKSTGVEDESKEIFVDLEGVSLSQLGLYVNIIIHT